MSDEPPIKIRRVDWYAGDFLSGMAGHPIGAAGWGVYIGIISICYAETRPSIPETEIVERLARMMTADPRTIRAGINALEKAGKLTRNGVEIEPRRVRDELEMTVRRVRDAREMGAKGGRPRKNNNDLTKGSGLFSEKLTPTPAPTTITSKDSEPNGSAVALAQNGQIVDLKTQIFGAALDWLAHSTGKPKSSLRSLVGRWCKDHGDPQVLDAMITAQRDAPVEPVAYITGRLNGTGKRKSAIEAGLGKWLNERKAITQ